MPPKPRALADSSNQPLAPLPWPGTQGPNDRRNGLNQGGGGSGPATAPAVPTNLVATVVGASALLTWTVPADGGSPITGYRITTSPLTQTRIAPPGASFTFSTDFDPLVPYTFFVIAQNAVGDSPVASSNPVTPNTIPAPAAPVAVAGGPGEIIVTITPPSPLGDVTDYIADIGDGSGDYVPITDIPITLEGVAPGDRRVFATFANLTTGAHGNLSPASNTVTVT
jgi:hypothetical protein